MAHYVRHGAESSLPWGTTKPNERPQNLMMAYAVKCSEMAMYEAGECD